jgi:maleylacetate reductase
VIAAAAERELAERLSSELPVAGLYDDVVMHVPIEVAQRGCDAAVGCDADLLVSVGGGSTVGLAKAIALSTGLPIVAVPTTYAGSEATNVWGLTEAGRKRTGVDDRVLPRTVIYDASLTTSLPVELSVASGLNAMAHCIDAFWAPRADPINAALAAEGILALAEGLPEVAVDPSQLPGREQLLCAAYLSGVAFASAGSGLHHKICHSLGGLFDLPHAQTHAVVLPYVLAFNGPAAPAAQRRIATALTAVDADEGLKQLRRVLQAPTALRDYGFTEADIPQAVDAILPSVPESNPRPVTADDLRQLLHLAWEGADPLPLSSPERD